MLLIAVFVLGFSSTAFAQFDGVGGQKLSIAVEARMKKEAQDRQKRDSVFISRLLDNAISTPISYSIETIVRGSYYGGGSAYPNKKEYSKNGEITGWKYKEGNNVYVILNRTDWENIYEECMPGGVTRAIGTSIVQQTITTKNGDQEIVYTYKKNALLDHKHYTKDGQEYTVITFTF